MATFKLTSTADVGTAAGREPDCNYGGHGCGDHACAGGTMGGGTMGGGSGGVSANMRSSRIHEELQAVGRLLPSWVIIM